MEWYNKTSKARVYIKQILNTINIHGITIEAVFTKKKGFNKIDALAMADLATNVMTQMGKISR